MPDILSQGSEHEPRSRPWRRLAVIAALVAAAAVVIAVRVPWSGHGGHPGRHAAASPAPSGPAVVSLPREPNGVAGPVRPWSPSLRLPVSGPQPVWYWPATGRRQAVGALPRTTSGYEFTRAVGGWAIQPEAPSEANCGDCAGPQLPVYFLDDRASSVSVVGAANAVAPAVRAGALWLISFPSRASLGTATGTAQEVSASGARIGGPVQLPPGYVIAQATTRGLLLSPSSAGRAATTARLWNPADRGFTRTFRNVIATGSSEVAWTPPCAAVCQVRVLNLSTGHTTVITMPKGSTPASGALSPDGRLLALQASYASGSAGGSLALQLEVASVRSGRLTAVPGTFASSDALVAFGWPARSDSLVAELGFTTKVQLAAWHPGARRPAVVDLSPHEDVTALVVG